MQFHPEAMTHSVLAWANHYRDLLTELGIDRDKLVRASRDVPTQAQQRAYRLTDRVLDGVPPSGRR